MSRSKALFVLGASALMTVSATAVAQTDAPMRFLSRPVPVDYTSKGRSVRYYKVTPKKSMKLEVRQPVQLVINVLPLLPADAVPDVGEVVRLRVAIQGGKTLAATVPIDPSQLTRLSDGSMASAPKRLRLPVEKPTQLMILAQKGEAAVTFSIKPMTRTVAEAEPPPTPDPAEETVAEPAPDPMAEPGPGDPMPIVPLIRRRVERLSLGIKSGVFFPTGPVDGVYGAGIENVYFGAELRYSMPFASRRFALAAEAGRYVLVDKESLVATDPFGSSVQEDVRVTHEVIPLIGDLVFKQPLGRKRALFMGLGGGVALTTQTEDVEFRNPVTTSATQIAARGRGGFEQKIGPGRLVLEGAYLHLLNETGQPFVGGAFGGLQYRFVF